MNRLTDRDLNYVPEEPFFVPMGAPAIADMDGELGGYDLNLLDFGSSLAGEPDDGHAMDQALADAAFTPGDFQAQNYDPINHDWGTLQPGFEKQLTDNETDLQGDPAPGGSGDPNQPPPPPSGAQPPPAQKCTAADFPGVVVVSTKTLPPRRLNDSPDTFVYVSSDTRVTTAKLVYSSDAAVWELIVQDDRTQGAVLHQVVLHANQKKAGHFSAAVSIAFAGVPGTRTYGYCIDIG